MKVNEVIDRLKQWHLPITVDEEKTRDRYLCGDPEVECTGVAVTCDATFEVMKKAAEKGINLIISHEGISYNYEYAGDIRECENEVLKAKLKFADEHNIVVWRDHDHMHGGRPPIGTDGKPALRARNDYIFYGTMKELGWEEYVFDDPMKPLWYKVPKTSARALAGDICKAWGLNGLRIVGNLDCEVETVWICEHINGGIRDVPKLDLAKKADVMIPLEICDYTLTTYVRDAAAMGYNKVIFEMGHFNAEELGMKYLARLLPEILDNQLKVEYIQSGDGFSYFVNK